jgi:hypothetical protein
MFKRQDRGVAETAMRLEFSNVHLDGEIRTRWKVLLRVVLTPYSGKG